jgi:hypothetical protein
MTRRETRKREHIPIRELLASALADKLPDAECNELRAAKVPAENVIRLFTPDHNIRHAEGGADLWWNLTMRRRGAELKAKDNRDTSEVAKNDRIGAAERERLQRMAQRLIGPSPFVDMPERTRPSRWPQGRKVRGNNNLQTRRGNRQ